MNYNTIRSADSIYDKNTLPFNDFPILTNLKHPLYRTMIVRKKFNLVI